MLRGKARIISKNEKIFAIEEGKDEAFIICTSFEQRTTAVVNRFSDKYKIQSSFIFKYDEEDRTNRRELNYLAIKKKLEESSKITFPILCNHHNTLNGISRFIEECRNRRILLNKRNITIDITTFTKQHLLALLKSVEKFKPKNLRLLYTEPQDYVLDTPLSRGIINIISVPAYGGHYYLEKENLLILLLGYEGDRASALWEEFSPHKTICLIGKPSFQSTWTGRVEKFNEKLLNKIPKQNKGYIPTQDPFKVSEELGKIIKKYKEEYNIYISPLGPKPQVVGCYLIAKKYPDVQVTYAIPKYHNSIFTKQVGKIWVYQ